MIRSFLALALLSLPAAAHADTTYSCDGNGIAVQVEAASNSAATFMQIDGRDIPALRSCMTWAHGNPRIGGKWRCPHGEAGSTVRYEVYPILSPANGDAPFVHIVKWDGDTSSVIELKDCE